MSGIKGIVIVCNLDTRGEDIVFVKQLIAGRGHNAILLDFSMEEPPPFAGDIRTEDVAARGGLPIEVVREKYRSDRDAATNNQITRRRGDRATNWWRRAACTASSASAAAPRRWSPLRS